MLINPAYLFGVYTSARQFRVGRRFEFFRRYLLMVLSLYVLVFGFLAYGQHVQPMPQAQPAPPMQKTIMLLDGEYFNLEVAMTKAELLRGLMYRNHLPEKTGMLFPFFPARTVNFWMKNTLIPLDMLFIRNQQVVHIITDASPCMADPCPSYNSVLPVDMVVELPAGTVRQYAINFGDPIQFMSAYDPVVQGAPQNTPASLPASSEADVQVIDVPVVNPAKTTEFNAEAGTTGGNIPVQSILIDTVDQSEK